MRLSAAVSALALVASLVGQVHGRDVFAHYMVGTVSEDHAHQDIDDAMAMGLDGFALNVGNPYEPFVSATLGYLFGYAAYRGFKLYLSMDVYASGDACYKGATSCAGPFDYKTLLTNYLGSSAWYHGPNGFPLISTFSSGGFTHDNWTKWKSDFANQMYFIPDFDETAGYYQAADDWWHYWGDVVDGIFSWESAWPIRNGFGGNYPGDVSIDVPVIHGARSRGKTYMMGLSLVQYKNAYGTNIYREGGVNLPTRLANILALGGDGPDFVQIQTWNDGPESHYIGNLWPEQNSDYQPSAYATQLIAPHTGLRPLITSFIHAYKSGGTQGSMSPPSNSPVGALWYKPILQSVNCPSDGTMYTAKPDGMGTASDQLSWAIVMPGGSSGMTVRASSNGHVLHQSSLNPGLNIGSATGVQAGSQLLEVLDGGGTTVFVANGGRCVSATCVDGIYNMNLQVLPLNAGSGGSNNCITGSQSGIFLESMSSSSSCADIQPYLLNSTFWDALDATNQLRAWQSSHQGTGFIADFATPLGNGQSFTSCSVGVDGNDCSRPNCGDLEHEGTVPGTGWKYCVEVSIANMRMYLQALFHTLTFESSQFASLQVSLEQLFWPSQSTSGLFLQELLNGISTGVGVAAALADIPIVGAGAEIIKGIINGVALAQTEADETIQNLAQIEEFVTGWINDALGTLSNIDGNLTSTGEYGDKTYADYFDHGAWLDYSNIPVLNVNDPSKLQVSSKDLNATFWSHLVAGLINVAWPQEKTFLMAFPMNESTFNSIVTDAGDNDSRLKHYYNQNGYFFQSLHPAGDDFGLPHVQDPPGWGSVQKYGFTTADIIESSAAAFALGGFNYSNQNVLDSIAAAKDKDTLLNSFKIPGVFTIPICQFDDIRWDLNTFLSILHSPGNNQASSAICYCQLIKDVNGYDLTQVIDFGDWVDKLCSDTGVPGIGQKQ